MHRLYIEISRDLGCVLFRQAKNLICGQKASKSSEVFRRNHIPQLFEWSRPYLSSSTNGRNIPSLSHSLSVIKNPYIVFIDNTLNQNNLNMPLPIAIAIAIPAAKALCLLVGSLVHEATKFVTSLGADHKDTVRGPPCLLIEDQKLGQDTPNPKESPSDALILYASRALVTLPNDSLAVGGSRYDLTDSNLLSMANSLDFSAGWYWILMRFIALVHALVQSALRSVVSDMRVTFASFFASVSGSAVQKKQVACIAFLIQVYFTRFMAKVFVILKEAVRLLKSRIEENISRLLGPLFPAGIGGRRSALLADSTSVGDSISADVGTLSSSS